MNERIKLLARQAWKEAYNVDPDDPRIARVHKAMEEGMVKFAELIVRECCFAVKPVTEYPMESVVAVEEFHRGYWVGCNDSTMRIKDRFGVEE